MPINHDYECPYCKHISEAFVEASERFITCPACHVGKAERVYLKFGQMLGKSKGLYPRFDVQLGCTVDSSQHMEQVAKSRGLVPMGREEFDRSRNAPRTPNPADSDEAEPWMIETAKRVWDDCKYGRIPNEPEKLAEMGKDAVEADVLDVKDAPVIKGA